MQIAIGCASDRTTIFFLKRIVCCGAVCQFHGTRVFPHFQGFLASLWHMHRRHGPLRCDAYFSLAINQIRAVRVLRAMRLSKKSKSLAPIVQALFASVHPVLNSMVLLVEIWKVCNTALERLSWSSRSMTLRFLWSCVCVCVCVCVRVCSFWSLQSMLAWLWGFLVKTNQSCSENSVGDYSACSKRAQAMVGPAISCASCLLTTGTWCPYLPSSLYRICWPVSYLSVSKHAVRMKASFGKVSNCIYPGRVTGADEYHHCCAARWVFDVDGSIPHESQVRNLFAWLVQKYKYWHLRSCCKTWRSAGNVRKTVFGPVNGDVFEVPEFSWSNRINIANF